MAWNQCVHLRRKKMCVGSKERSPESRPCAAPKRLLSPYFGTISLSYAAKQVRCRGKLRRMGIVFSFFVHLRANRSSGEASKSLTVRFPGNDPSSLSAERGYLRCAPPRMRKIANEMPSSFSRWDDASPDSDLAQKLKEARASSEASDLHQPQGGGRGFRVFLPHDC
ncbi:hypothetical protein MAPG_06368 [Magnaporthiopsis poae ATCC 64411]|uniref:Uncharacterized protein n=1 Tax=Magnaporthiopsis poae (strain ATCC 64411 / 73-15) TaxID=644358 RepID=A0A0C4E1U7_MAGP6|nr:hypothetical protein MAPG_06368 [Magnaporthiopsis poae ATCC 64411]